MNTCQWPRLRSQCSAARRRQRPRPADDDEELNSVDQMLKDKSAQNSIAWFRGCAKNGDLGRLLDAARDATWATQKKAAEADRRRRQQGVINGLLAGQCGSCSEDARAAS